MKQSSLVIIVVTLVACSEPDPGWPPTSLNLDRNHGGLETVISSHIAANRESIEYQVLNNGARDVFCETLSYRLILDDPNSYLEVGERIYIQEHVFLRAEEYFSGVLKPDAPTGGESWHIRAIDVYRGIDSCVAATFQNYCEYAQQTREEQAFLKYLFEISTTHSCGALWRWLEKLDAIDLRPFDAPTARPLIYLTSPSRLIVRDSEDVRTFVQHLANLQRSMWKPTVIAHSRSCDFEQQSQEPGTLPPEECRVPVPIGP